ncbi:hypothetical protein E4T56_gene17192 [Termitomyces sp. T112]|nr:hypothetical protein E4T56_gene17192 [Termitomyces sp. T112]
MDPPSLASIVLQISDVQLVNIAAAGALTWLVYDILLTISLEVSMLERGRWTFQRFVYLFVRYYTVFTLSINLGVTTSWIVPFRVSPAKHFRVGWFWFIGYNGPVLSTAVGDYLLLRRIIALYGYRRRVTITLSALYLFETLLAFATVAVEVSSITPLPRMSTTPVPGCLATLPTRIKFSLAAWISALVLTSIFFVLSLAKFFKTILESTETGTKKTLKDILRTRRIMPTILLFTRDNSFYFFFAFTLQLLNLIFIVVLAKRPIQQMGTAWLMAGYAVMASRLMLNTQSLSCVVVVDGSFELSSFSQATYSYPRFASRNTQRTIFSHSEQAVLETS